MEKDINIGGRLHSTATGNVVAGANEILDDAKGKKQSVVNQETDNALEALDGRADALEATVGAGGSVDTRIAAAKAEIIGNAASDYNTLGKVEDKIQAEVARATAAENDRYTKSETYTKTELNNLITTPNQGYVTVVATDQTSDVTDVLPASGSADTIYRVCNWDGSAASGSEYDVTCYSEYAWDGTEYQFLCVKSQIGEVFDISAYNSNTEYVDLAAALGNDGANVPASIRRGGMSVKFVCSSDHKYVQYRLMADSWSTVAANWQGVDDEPTAGSDNLVKSGGVYEEINGFIQNGSQSIDFEISDNNGNSLVLCSGGHIKTEKFDSEKAITDEQITIPNNTNADFTIEDDNNNVLVELKNGHIKTEKFDSERVENGNTYYNQDIHFIEPVSGANSRLWTSSTLSDRGEKEWLIIYCHGNGVYADGFWNGLPSAFKNYCRLNKLNIGYIQYQNTTQMQGGTLYGEVNYGQGNPQTVSAVINLYNYLQAHYNFHKEVILACGSMGGLTAGQIAYERQIPIAFCFFNGPVPSLQGWWTNGYSNRRVAIRNAFDFDDAGKEDDSQGTVTKNDDITPYTQGHDWYKMGLVEVDEILYRFGFPNMYIYYSNDNTYTIEFRGDYYYPRIKDSLQNAGTKCVLTKVGDDMGHAPNASWLRSLQDDIWFYELGLSRYNGTDNSVPENNGENDNSN